MNLAKIKGHISSKTCRINSFFLLVVAYLFFNHFEGQEQLSVARRPSPAGALQQPAGPRRLTDLARCPGTGRRTHQGHGERLLQVPAELLALGPRAGREGPGMLPLSTGGFCVRVPRSHHPPLGPKQVSAPSPVSPQLCCRLPAESRKRVSLPCPLPSLPGLPCDPRSLPVLR